MVDLLSEFSHTLSPRQAGMACHGFFYPPLQMGQGIQQTPASKYGIASQGNLYGIASQEI